MPIAFAVFSGLALLMTVAALLAVLYRRRTHKHDRLNKAFQLAKLARKSGSGIQGHHYSPYRDRDPS